MQVTPIPALSDNYIYLISWNSNAIVIDPSEAQPVLDELEKTQLNLLHILNTHHHSDHIAGNDKIKKATNCTIIAPDDRRISGKDEIAREGKDIVIEGITIQVIFVPGHTTTHIAYFFPEKKWLFSGDSLFLGGCGRIFEGTPEEMQHSLIKLTKLPEDTLVFCGHEYTQKNLEFALSIEPNNQAVKERLEIVKNERVNNRPTVPATLEEELLTNPFLRSDQHSLRQALHMEEASDLEVFTTIRKMKDDF